MNWKNAEADYHNSDSTIVDEWSATLPQSAREDKGRVARDSGLIPISLTNKASKNHR
jgi:hypothetical protein